MTPSQRDALARPCRLACETVHPRYGSLVQPPTGGTFGLVLTVNNGWE